MSSSLKAFSQVYFYAGHGDRNEGPYPFDQEYEMFAQIGKKTDLCWRIERVKGENLVTVLNTAPLASSLLVIPAGPTSKLEALFQREEVTAIKSAVKEGLCLYATCGSVYWLAAQRIWLREKPKEGQVALLNASVSGPLYPLEGQERNTSFEHCPVSICDAAAKVYVTALLSGGGKFCEEPLVSSDPFLCKQKIIPLAFYANDTVRPGKPAVIACNYGKGYALLSMVHFTLEAHPIADIPGRPEKWKEIKDFLSPQEERVAFLEHLFAMMLNWCKK